MAKNPYPRRFEGFERLPPASTFVIVVNHYNRPGLHPYHCAMAVSVGGREPEAWAAGALLALHQRMVWRALRTDTDSGWLLPAGPSVASLASTISSCCHDGRSWSWRAPRRFGTCCSALAKSADRHNAGRGRLRSPGGAAGGQRALPDDSSRGMAIRCSRSPSSKRIRRSCCVSGTPFRLSVPRDLSRDEADRLAREQTMVAIGRLLPREYWGVVR